MVKRWPSFSKSPAGSGHAYEAFGEGLGHLPEDDLVFRFRPAVPARLGGVDGEQPHLFAGDLQGVAVVDVLDRKGALQGAFDGDRGRGGAGVQQQDGGQGG